MLARARRGVGGLRRCCMSAHHVRAQVYGDTLRKHCSENHLRRRLAIGQHLVIHLTFSAVARDSPSGERSAERL